MKIQPSHSTLRKYINYFWVVRDAPSLFREQQQVYAFPGITPEMIIVLDGHYSYQYLGEHTTTYDSRLFSFLHGDIYLDLSGLQSFVVVVFQSQALSAVLPFIDVATSCLMRKPIQSVGDIYPDFTPAFIQELCKKNATELIATLEEWLLLHCEEERSGFMADLVQDLPNDYQVETLRQITNYSQSTLERHFRKDTGLTPKKYQRIRRFRAVVEHLYATRSTDWGQYVYNFGFFDQSHFIKEVRAFTGFTPTQLIETPGILPYRPS